MKMAKVESAVRIALDFYDCFNQHDPERMMSLLSEDCVYEHTSPIPDGTLYLGRENLSVFWKDYFQNTQASHIEIEDIFGLGLRSVVRWKLTWIETDGKSNHLRGVSLFQVENGLIRKIYAYSKH